MTALPVTETLMNGVPSLLLDPPPPLSFQSDVIENICNNSREISISRLPDTLECDRAAEAMRTTGLGSQVLNVEADLEKIQTIRDAIYRGHTSVQPNANGKIVFDIFLFAGGLLLEAYNRNEQNARAVERYKSAQADVYRAQRQYDAISSPDRPTAPTAQEVRDAETAVTTAEGIRDKERAQCKSQTGGSAACNAEVIAGETIVITVDPTEGTPCVDEICFENLEAAAFGGAREAIAQCEAQVIQQEPQPNAYQQFNGDSVLFGQSCEIVRTRCPAFEIDPEAECEEPPTGEELLSQLETDQLNSLIAGGAICQLDDVICNAAMEREIRRRTGVEASNTEKLMDAMLCGKDFEVGVIQAEEQDEEGLPACMQTGTCVDLAANNDSRGFHQCGAPQYLTVESRPQYEQCCSDFLRASERQRFFFFSVNQMCTPYQMSLLTLTEPMDFTATPSWNGAAAWSSDQFPTTVVQPIEVPVQQDIAKSEFERNLEELRFGNVSNGSGLLMLMQGVGSQEHRARVYCQLAESE